MNFLSLLLGKQYNVLTYLPEAVLVIDETGKIFYANKKAFKLFSNSLKLAIYTPNYLNYVMVVEYVLHAKQIQKNPIH